MKIRVYGKDYAEQVRKYETFTLDTEQFPQLELEIEAITSAYEEGETHTSQRMKSLLENLQVKMWEVNFNINDDGHASIWEQLEPDGGEPEWDKYKNESSWLELESVEKI